MRISTKSVGDAFRFDIAEERRRAENDMILALLSKMRPIENEHRSMGERVAALEARLPWE
jgi:hypothetical protein